MFPKENKNVLNKIRELVIGKGDLKERDAARFIREQESELKQLLREIERQNPTMIPALVNPGPLCAKEVQILSKNIRLLFSFYTKGMFSHHFTQSTKFVLISGLYFHHKLKEFFRIILHMAQNLSHVKEAKR